MNAELTVFRSWRVSMSVLIAQWSEFARQKTPRLGLKFRIYRLKKAEIRRGLFELRVRNFKGARIKGMMFA